MSPVTWTIVLSIGTGVVTLLNTDTFLIAGLSTLGVLFAITLIYAILILNVHYQELSSARYKIVVRKSDPGIFSEEENFTLIPCIEIENVSDFPIEIDYSNIRWEIDGLTGVEKVYTPKTRVIQARSVEILRGPTFDTPKPEEDVWVDLEIFVSAVIGYGKVNRLKYEHCAAYILACSYNSNEDFELQLRQISVKSL